MEDRMHSAKPRARTRRSLGLAVSLGEADRQVFLPPECHRGLELAA